jgi:hypothetical protein
LAREVEVIGERGAVGEGAVIWCRGIGKAVEGGWEFGKPYGGGVMGHGRHDGARRRRGHGGGSE